MTSYQKQTVAQYSPYSDDETMQTNTPYKGLSTSITHMFADPATARIDCCAITCCGILQSDYNRYILLGKRPPTFKHRVLQHLLVPISFFTVAGFCAVTIQDRNINQLFSTFFIFLCLALIVGGCFRSGYKRCFFRRALLKKVNERNHGIIVSESEDEDDDHLMLPQTNFEMSCAHRACGYYKSDITKGKDEDESEDRSRNLCGCLFKAFSDSCCGKILGYHLQICGMCALAQEGRELDSMVPVDKRRMDYVSFQFYTDYFNPIRKLREEKDNNLLNHYKALSKLSRMILKTLGFTIFTVFLLSIARIAKNFRLGNMLVFIATFLQAFLILYLVHWRLHRFDLSLDAVIKYFASGFILSITSALFFESFISLALQLVLVIIMPPQVANNDGGYGQASEYRPYFSFIEESPWNMYADSDGDKIAFHRQHPIISTIFLFLNAYVVAALVEELSKYFGFIMVEHPDFLCDSELKAAAEFSACDGEDDDSGAGGDESEEDSVAEIGVNDSPCVSLTFEGRFNCAGGGKFNCTGGDGFNCAGGEQDNRGLASDNRQISKRFLGENDATEQHRVELHPAPPRSSRSIGAGITVAMVSVALGFACCENLIYIFLYHGDSLGSEVTVLIFRSLFPVHPLCAAIQSIGVCKQQLENDRSIQLGRIIIPAIVLHGSYDFIIMFLSFLAGGEDGGNGKSWLISLVAECSIVFVGWIFYVKESDAQTVRLDHMDAARKFGGVNVCC